MDLLMSRKVGYLKRFIVKRRRILLFTHNITSWTPGPHFVYLPVRVLFQGITDALLGLRYSLGMVKLAFVTIGTLLLVGTELGYHNWFGLSEKHFKTRTTSSERVVWWHKPVHKGS
jgi:hypothetical protein